MLVPVFLFSSGLFAAATKKANITTTRTPVTIKAISLPEPFKVNATVRTAVANAVSVAAKASSRFFSHAQTLRPGPGSVAEDTIEDYARYRPSAGIAR